MGAAETTTESEPAMELLNGRTAIVTGAGRGLGRAHALALATAGAAVVVNDVDAGVDGSVTGGTAAQAVVDEIRAAGGRAVADIGSVADWDRCGDTVALAVAEFGGLDIVVNNAGVTRDRMLTSMSSADLDITIDVHVKGTFGMSHHACRYWRTRHKGGAGDVSGRIVNTTSGSGMVGNPGQTAYAAAKAAIIGMTQSLALEASRYQVTVNAISPIALTRMTEGVMQSDTRGSGFDRLDPANASGLVVYLASKEAGWLTGQVLRIDGANVTRMDGWRSGSSYTSSTEGALDVAELTVAVPRLFGTAPMGLAALRA